MSIASDTLPGVNPPATTSLNGPCFSSSAMGTALCQSNGLPVPPGFSVVPESKNNASNIGDKSGLSESGLNRANASLNLLTEVSSKDDAGKAMKVLNG